MTRKIFLLEIARWAMGRARRRRPTLGPVRTFCAGWLAVYVIEFPLEIFAVHHGLAHARSDIETLNGHVVLRIGGADCLACKRAFRHRVFVH